VLLSHNIIPFLFLDSVHSRSDAGESSEGNDFLSPLPPSLSVPPPPLPPLVHLVNDLPTPIKSSLKKPNNNNNNLTGFASPSPPPSVSSMNHRNNNNLQTKENPIHSNTITTTSLATPSHPMTALPSSVTAEGLLLSSNRPQQPTSTSSSTRKASTGAAHTMMSALEFLSPQQQRAVRYSAPGSSDLKANHTSSKGLFSSPFTKTSGGNKTTAPKKDGNDGDICL
jgi:hypothetical protein